MAILFLCMTLPSINRRGLSNTAGHEHLPKKTKVAQAALTS